MLLLAAITPSFGCSLIVSDPTFVDPFDAGRDAGTSPDAGRDAGISDAGGRDALVTSDASCELGTLENCTACGESCVWSCTPTGCNDANHLSLGYSHACVSRQRDGIACWGWNDTFCLGDGTLTDSALPVEAAFEGRFIDVCAGGSIIGTHFSCALTATGIVSCWGSNLFGTLGSASAPNPSMTPFPVGLVNRASMIDCGEFFACALLDNGEIWCWGSRPEVPSQEPRLVGGLSARPVQLAVGSFHACALLETGTVQCWGGNTGGALGDRTTTDRADAVAAIGVNNAVLVAAGVHDSCVAIRSGEVLCWGNGYGPTPVAVPGVAGPRSLTTSCAGLDDGVVCWSAGGPAASVAGTAGPFVRVSTGVAHCGLTEQGAVYCWGDGPLGSGVMSSASALLVPAPRG